ncbi:type II toxin-antitoxin system PemK/MazF family toxin [Adhaeribacter rhizoryzae]|uniref:Type II toxin-antitoxin system PemK/MazF family toxin n=1 Tax=Adhaeribacter rhizoryzae TaxID=2607907 RepID=A0A5M6D7A1_9BACT|nr:type II toxin-antitoxin system PemK/MazF family toxin [Adhaeribacter rhizoryzae]KAA5543377.1 type II toxin-antitoxin system PemK/MazF family toxin [Adhaeribacter rhizoryzae]
MRKGDILLIPFPFTDLTGQKNRPALVLVTTDTDITVAFITSQIKWQEEHDLKLEPSAKNGLKKTSLVRLSKLATINNELLIGKLGNLIEADIQQLNKNLIKLFQLEK